MGDPARNALLETVLDTIEKDNLLERTRSAGDVLQKGLVSLQVSLAKIFLFYVPSQHNVSMCWLDV